ncbi:SCO3242 family prenyltransferase [Actinoplanes sp. NPDC089786]|uniref:SCO3242 family prenyltransferase n=1 Tax=Actinoplanes sp. NPDC089786 TaxID=3155185 RepID=UPI00341BD8B4
MRFRDLISLVRAPAALSVPGDVVAGAGAAGALSPSTAGLAGASVCLYWAGMAANDWADRELDAVERPERPIPSGRISPRAAFGIAAGLTGAGLALAGAAGGRRALAVAGPLAAAVWAYDLKLKNTAAGPAGMAVCRGLDVMLGASGSARMARAVPSALAVALHTYTVTALSRREVSGAEPRLAAVTLATTAALTGAVATTGHLWKTASERRAHALHSGPPSDGAGEGAGRRSAQPTSHRGGRWDGLGGGRVEGAFGRGGDERADKRRRAWRLAATAVMAAGYAVKYGRAQAAVIGDPAAPRVRAAVGAGITSLPSLQGALAARSGAPFVGMAVAAAAPLAGALARKVSPT